tara:strand:+ start:473 stop:934 length:462 start_codon:yes stop_codon:yes gene_type:complete
MVELTHRKHSIGQSAYHLVWRPKYNLKIFRDRFPRRVCEEALKTVVEKWRIRIYEMEVMVDHIHLFVEIPPTMTVSFALQLLKGGSARIILKRCYVWGHILSQGHKKRHLWSPGKFFRSVGSVTAEVVENYIKNSNNWEFEFIDKKQTKLSSF